LQNRSDVAIHGEDTMPPPLPLTPDDGVAKHVAFDALVAVPEREPDRRRRILPLPISIRKRRSWRLGVPALRSLSLARGSGPLMLARREQLEILELSVIFRTARTAVRAA
jgi:hypothetical protein